MRDHREVGDYLAIDGRGRVMASPGINLNVHEQAMVDVAKELVSAGQPVTHKALADRLGLVLGTGAHANSYKRLLRLQSMGLIPRRETTNG